MPASAKSGVFISYARSDGEALAADLRSRLAAANLALWRDREHMEGGRDWWLQITAALDAVEFMVLIMTPGAAASALVRKEWRYARQRGVCVYPVTSGAALDFDALPRWMRSVHFYDLAHDWPRLLNDLTTRCAARRVPFMAEDLPPEFVRRDTELAQLIARLVDRKKDEPVPITLAIRAAGGYGKTLLARALCHDQEVQNAFDDGILWVTLGERPGDLAGRVEDLIHLVSGERPGFSGIEAAVAMLVELLADRDILLIVDDVWDIAHLEPFVQGGPRCARVITTRTLDATPRDAVRVDVGPMRGDEAMALLGYGLPDLADTDLPPLAARLCKWPLLLNLTNAALRDRVRSGQTVAAALSYINRALDKRGLTFFDARDPVARHQAVAKTLELSVERLDEREQARFVELAVFPEDVNVPLAPLERLWARTGGLDDFETEYLCDRLSRLSLVMTFDPTRRFVRLHDVIRHWLIHRLGDRLEALQRELLDAHRPPSAAWADLQLSDRYMWDHLAFHLESAGRQDELIATVLDLRYLAAKTLARNALATERDLLAAERAAPAEETLRVLRPCFVQSSHLFDRCESFDDLSATLHSRLQHATRLQPISAALRRSLATPHLEALLPLPDLPHPALVRTLTSATTVWGCAISPDGALIASAAYDGTLTVWEAATGAVRWRVTAHDGWARRCAFSPDGSFIVSASYDRRLKIWDPGTGELRRVLTGHTGGVNDCAVSADSTVIVSASHDETLRVWDARTGELRHTLAAQWEEQRGWLSRGTAAGHVAAIWACAVSPDGTLILSASSDQTLKIWDAATGAELRTLSGHTAMVTGCAFSPDATRIASAGADRTVRVWDTATGRPLLVIEGHGHVVNRCAFTPRGSIVSVSADRSVRLWDGATGAGQGVWFGHADWVNDCAVAPDGSFVISASNDHTVKMWEVTPAPSAAPPGRHHEWVNRVAISPGGDRVVSASSDMTLKVWSPAGGLIGTLIAHDNSVRCCAFGTAGNYLVSASADKSLRVWDSASGLVLHTLTGHRDWVNGCSVSPDGTLILSASSDRTLRVWEGAVERLRIVAHGDSINACVFSPDGRFFVSGSVDGTLKVWSVANAREVWASFAVEQRTFSEEAWHEVLAPLVLPGHARSVNDCAVAPDSSFVVSASSDRTIRIWNPHSGALLRTLAGHHDDVDGCAISPDGQLVASASRDQTLKIWNVATAACLTTLHVDGGLGSCAWFPDGKRLVAAGAGGIYFLAVAQV